jgi:predicted enzyme related to lactoylglutathione lyase
MERCRCRREQAETPAAGRAVDPWDRPKDDGGAVRREIFPFPGGRRFHFADPAGNELAVWGPAAGD